MPTKIRVIDSHTGGEPTRIIYQGGPDLGTGSLQEQLGNFRREFDHIRTTTILEPRGSDVLVGGLLTNSNHPDCDHGIIFFNNLGFLGMCGHGTIGLMSTLKHLGRIEDGLHQIDTPVGVVAAKVEGDETTLTNVDSYCLKQDVEIEVTGLGKIVGDVAWGGNWFFLVKNYEGDLVQDNTTKLLQDAMAIRNTLTENQITGLDGAWIDHVELFGPAVSRQNDSRNFVLCPGGEYDRSPCGTGTSAKLACLAAEKKLEPGKTWLQESIIGSLFSGSFQWSEKNAPKEAVGPLITPVITGSAFVCGQAELIINPKDPFRNGIVS